MSGVITLRVKGFQAVYIDAPGGVLAALDSPDGTLWDAELYLSRSGVSVSIPGLGKTVGYLPSGWADAFGSLQLPESALWAGKRVAVTLTGTLAAHVVHVLCQWKTSSRRRGRPMRAERWDADREEFFSMVLHHGSADLDVTRSIAIAEAENRGLFDRTFDGANPDEAARSDYYRRRREAFAEVPPGSIPLGRIRGMRFEFADTEYLPHSERPSS